MTSDSEVDLPAPSTYFSIDYLIAFFDIWYIYQILYIEFNSKDNFLFTRKEVNWKIDTKKINILFMNARIKILFY